MQLPNEEDRSQYHIINTVVIYQLLSFPMLASSRYICMSQEIYLAGTGSLSWENGLRLYHWRVCCIDIWRNLCHQQRSSQSSASETRYRSYHHSFVSLWKDLLFKTYKSVPNRGQCYKDTMNTSNKEWRTWWQRWRYHAQSSLFHTQLWLLMK